MPVNNSVSPPFLDKDGHAFKLHVLNSSAKSTHQKNQRFKRKTKFREHDRNIRSAVKIVIPPETSVAVPVLANFPSGSNCLYVEKVFSTNRNADDVYTPPDSLILKRNPRTNSLLGEQYLQLTQNYKLFTEPATSILMSTQSQD